MHQGLPHPDFISQLVFLSMAEIKSGQGKLRFKATSLFPPSSQTPAGSSRHKGGGGNPGEKLHFTHQAGHFCDRHEEVKF